MAESPLTKDRRSRLEKLAKLKEKRQLIQRKMELMNSIAGTPTKVARARAATEAPSLEGSARRLLMTPRRDPPDGDATASPRATSGAVRPAGNGNGSPAGDMAPSLRPFRNGNTAGETHPSPSSSSPHHKGGHSKGKKKLSLRPRARSTSPPLRPTVSNSQAARTFSAAGDLAGQSPPTDAPVPLASRVQPRAFAFKHVAFAFKATAQFKSKLTRTNTGGGIPTNTGGRIPRISNIDEGTMCQSLGSLISNPADVQLRPLIPRSHSRRARTPSLDLSSSASKRSLADMTVGSSARELVETSARWFWLSDIGGWLAYDEAYEDVLETAWQSYTARKGPARIDLGEYVVDLRTMRSFNVWSEAERKVRRDEPYSKSKTEDVNRMLKVYKEKRWDDNAQSWGQIMWYGNHKRGDQKWPKKHQIDRKLRPFLRVHDSCTGDTLADLVGDNRFELGKPHRGGQTCNLISVTGGAKNLDMGAHTTQRLKEDLVSLALMTSGCIISGGTAVGVMSLIGQALHEHERGHEIDCIGIMTHGLIQGHEKFEGKVDLGVVEVNATPTHAQAKSELVQMDEDHTHYVFVDTGDSAKWGGEIELRAEFESSFAITNQIPLMLVVVGGGENTLETIIRSITSHDPILLVKGSGGISDILAQSLEEDEGVMDRIMSDAVWSKDIARIERAVALIRSKTNVRIIDYTAGESATGMFLDLSLQAHLNVITQHRYRTLDGPFMIRKFLAAHKFTQVRHALEKLRQRSIKISKRGQKRRLSQLLQFSLLVALRSKPTQDHAQRAVLVDYILCHLGWGAGEQRSANTSISGRPVDISNVIMINELYAERCIVEKATIAPRVPGAKGPPTLKLIFSCGEIFDYQPIVLELSSALTIEDVKKAYLGAVQDRLQMSSQKDNSSDIATLLQDIDEPDILSEIETEGGTTVSLLLSVIVICVATVYGFVRGYYMLGMGLHTLVAAAFIIVFVHCLLALHGRELVLASGTRLDLARLQTRWQPTRMQFFCGGLASTERMSKVATSQASGSLGRWWRELQDVNKLSDEKLQNGDRVIVSVRPVQPKAKEKLPGESNIAFARRMVEQGNVAAGSRDDTLSVTLPSDVKNSLKFLGLLWNKATQSSVESVVVRDVDSSASARAAFDGMLNWACALGDMHLVQVFWERNEYPIKAALRVGFLCRELARMKNSPGNPSPSATLNDNETHEQRLTQIADEFKSKAYHMIQATAKMDGGNQLGMSWVTNRLQMLQLAFASKAEKTVEEQTHPALRENIDDFWETQGTSCLWGYTTIKFHRRHTLAVVSHVCFILLHLTMCNMSCLPITEEDGLLAALGSIGWRETLFWFWCFSLSLDHALLRLSMGQGQREFRETVGLLDTIYLCLNHAALGLRLAARCGICVNLASALSRRLLYWACVFLGMRVLNFMCMRMSGVATVLNIMCQFMISDDNAAFVMILGSIAVSCALTLGGLSFSADSFNPDPTFYEEPMLLLRNMTSQIVPTSASDTLSEFAESLKSIVSWSFGVENNPEGFSQRTISEEAIDIRFAYHVYWIFVNTYLVQGFLVGIISDQFNHREQTQFQSLVFKLKLIREYQQSMLPAPLSAVRNLWRLATEVTLVENMVLPLKSIKLALKLARSAAPTLPRASSPSSSAARGDDDRRVDVGVAAPPASITVVVQAAGLIMLRCFFFAAVTLSLACWGPLASLVLMRINVKAPLNDTSGAIDGACFHTGGGGGQQLARSRELELRAQDLAMSDADFSSAPTTAILSKVQRLEEKFKLLAETEQSVRATQLAVQTLSSQMRRLLHEGGHMRQHDPANGDAPAYDDSSDAGSNAGATLTTAVSSESVDSRRLLRKFKSEDSAVSSTPSFQ